MEGWGGERGHKKKILNPPSPSVCQVGQKKTSTHTHTQAHTHTLVRKIEKLKYVAKSPHFPFFCTVN